MKVKIKKEGKVKEFDLIKSWEDVTLETWLKLIHFHKGTKSEEAEETIAALSNIPKDLIKRLELKDVAAIMSAIAEAQENQNSSLKRIIQVDGKRYGFHPDLDSITLVLYRPIVDETDSGIYTIDAYDGNIAIRAEQMRKMSAEQVQSALVFFYLFVNLLCLTSASFLILKQKEMKKQ